MSDRDRVRRPLPERTAPIRHMTGIFGAPNGAPQKGAGPAADGEGAAAKTFNRATHEGVPPHAAPTDATQPRSAPGIQGAIARSVEIGYRVIDEYIHQGQDVARTLREGRASKETLMRDAGDLAARLARYASDFVGTWLELFELAATNGNSTRQDASGTSTVDEPAEPRSSDGNGRYEAPPRRVAVSLVASREAEASLQLDEKRRGEIRVHALRCVDADLPRIEDVEVVDSAGTAPVTIRVRISEDRAPGTYEGLVIDTRNLPVGVLRVVVAP